MARTKLGCCPECGRTYTTRALILRRLVAGQRTAVELAVVTGAKLPTVRRAIGELLESGEVVRVRSWPRHYRLAATILADIAATESWEMT